jgi:hypothetical protein
MALRSNLPTDLRAGLPNRPTLSVELPMPTMNRGSSNAASGGFKAPSTYGEIRPSFELPPFRRLTFVREP